MSKKHIKHKTVNKWLIKLMHKNFYIEKIEQIKNEVDTLCSDLSDEVEQTADTVANSMQRNPAILRDVLKNITSGYSLPEAILITAFNFGESLARVRAIYNHHRISNKQNIAYAKNFLIHKLKEKGFKIVDIAFILDTNKQTVYNYLKKDCLI